MSYLNKEVNCTEPSPSVSFPWLQLRPGGRSEEASVTGAYPINHILYKCNFCQTYKCKKLPSCYGIS